MARKKWLAAAAAGLCWFGGSASGRAGHLCSRSVLSFFGSLQRRDLWRCP